MFEFLTPTRRRAVGPPQPQIPVVGHGQHPTARPTSAADAQYVDRVF